MSKKNVVMFEIDFQEEVLENENGEEVKVSLPFFNYLDGENVPASKITKENLEKFAFYRNTSGRFSLSDDIQYLYKWTEELVNSSKKQIKVGSYVVEYISESKSAIYSPGINSLVSFESFEKAKKTFLA